MYSPKIKEDLVQMLYRLKLKHQMPMTRLVDEILRPTVCKWHHDDIDGDPVYANYDNQTKLKFETAETKSRLKKGVYNVRNS